MGMGDFLHSPMLFPRPDLAHGGLVPAIGTWRTGLGHIAPHLAAVAATACNTRATRLFGSVIVDHYGGSTLLRTCMVDGE
jgi:hypothetical protein